MTRRDFARRFPSVLAVAAGALAISAVAGAQQLPPPATVFVWTRSGDAYDLAAQGFIWQQMGFINAAGRPASVNTDGELHFGDTIVGSVIGDLNGDPIGYRNVNSTLEAYDINGTTANINSAWQRVANNGTLNVLSHGTERNVNIGNGQRQIQQGGGLLLNNRAPADGFTAAAGGAGTGAGFGAAARLTGRANDDAITIDLNNCFSANDPDGAGAITSVVASTVGITGRAGARGHVPTCNVTASFVWTGGTQAERNAATAALGAARRAAGFQGSLSLWLVSLPWETRFQTIDAAVNNANVRLGITYRLQAQPQGGAQLSDIPDLIIPYSPVMLVDPVTTPGASARMNHEDRPDVDAIAWFEVYQGSLFASTYFHMNQLPELPAPAPAGSPYCVSGIFDYRLNHQTTSIAGLMSFGLRVLEGAPEDAQMYFFDGASWVPMASTIVDGQSLATLSGQVGIYAAFSAVPAPGAAGLLGLAGVLAARRRR